MAVPGLGFALTNLNINSGNYIGANGVNINNGQNVAVITTPLTGALPIPAVYSLGGFNVGTAGIGFTLPSVFGFGLAPTFQIGAAPTADAPDGLLLAQALDIGSVIPTQQLVTVTGLLSAALGIQDPTTRLAAALYTAVVTPAATQISNLIAENYGSFAKNYASGLLAASALYKELTTQSNSATNPASAAAQQSATAAQLSTPQAGSNAPGVNSTANQSDTANAEGTGSVGHSPDATGNTTGTTGTNSGVGSSSGSNSSGDSGNGSHDSTSGNNHDSTSGNSH